MSSEAAKLKFQQMSPIRRWTNETIFRSNTPAGKYCDLLLIVLIILSISIVMLESVEEIRLIYGDWLTIGDWLFTILFTIEYLLRLWSARNPFYYAKTFYGIVDLMAILPSYISLAIPAAKFLTVIRILRVFRVFRILKLVQYVHESKFLAASLYASRRKIMVFLLAVLTLVVILGSSMFVIEGPENGFTSIPMSVYWAIVTLTTVGYGDISPKTPLGQALSVTIMIMGYSIIAVPTGIVTSEMTRSNNKQSNLKCLECKKADHMPDSIYCRLCSKPLIKCPSHKKSY